ncbi:MAG: NAD-dependent epimerase/dehydratase family protein [Bacillota bacterium]|nr:NAD-dependent epimerase/dehydratase family protein [Bacillota bacterium]
MKKILCLGSNSFTGYHFKDFIQKHKLYEKYAICGVDKDDYYYSHFKWIWYEKVNPLDKDSLKNIIVSFKPNYLINMIGTFQAVSFDEYYQLNANISRNIFEIIIENNIVIEKILLIGSAAEYGNARQLPVRESSPAAPVNLYGFSKLIQTEIAQYYFNNLGINVNVARTFNIIGKGISRKLAVGNFIEQINNAKDGDIIKVGNIKPKRDYLHIADVVEAYWQILMNGYPGEIYNVCSSVSLSMEEILTNLMNMAGKKLYFEIDDSLIKNNDISDIYGDNSKLISHTPWSPKKDLFSDLF